MGGEVKETAVDPTGHKAKGERLEERNSAPTGLASCVSEPKPLPSTEAELEPGSLMPSVNIESPL